MTLIVSKFNTALEDWKQQERTQSYYKKKERLQQAAAEADRAGSGDVPWGGESAALADRAEQLFPRDREE